MISPPDSIQNVGNDSLMRDSLDALARIPQAEIGPPLPVAPFKETISEILPNFFYTQYSKDMQVHDRLIDSESWIVLLLLASLFLIGIIKTYYQKETQIILLGVFKRAGLVKLVKDENTMMRRCILLLMLLFFIVSPVFVYQLSGFYNLKTAFLPYFPAYFQLLLIGAGALSLKLLTIQLIGRLFYSQDEATSYLLSIIIMNCILGIAFIPITLGIKLTNAPYNEIFLNAGVFLFCLLYLYSLIIGWLAGFRNSRLSKFHLFLYFCSLEILPVILIIKAVRNLI
jgi:hypothetical protein